MPFAVAHKQQYTAFAFGLVPATWLASPVMIDVSWARSGRIYVRVVAGAAVTPVYMRIERYLENPPLRSYVDSLRDLSTIGSNTPAKTGTLGPYNDEITVSPGNFNTWLDFDATRWVAVNFSQLDGGVDAATVEAILIPQYKGTI